MDHLPHNISQLFGKCSNHHIFDHLRQKGPKLLIAVASFVPFCSHSFHCTRPKRPLVGVQWCHAGTAAPVKLNEKKLGESCESKAPRKFHKPWLIESTPYPVTDGKWRFLEIPYLVIMKVGGWSKASLNLHVITVSIFCFKKSNGLGESSDMSYINFNPQVIRVFPKRWVVLAKTNTGPWGSEESVLWGNQLSNLEWHGYGPRFPQIDMAMAPYSTGALTYSHDEDVNQSHTTYMYV